MSFLQSKSDLQIGVFVLVWGMVLAILAGLLWLTRGDWVYPTQVQSGQNHPLSNELVVGQTFVSYEAGLEAIEIRLTATNISPEQLEQITFDLWTGPPSDETRLPIQLQGQEVAWQDDGWLRFSFDPLADSRRAYYYFSFQPSFITATEVVSVLSASGQAYLDGAMYVNEVPLDAQMSFRLVHARPEMALDWGRHIGRYLFQGGVVFLFLFIPGFSLLLLLGPPPQVDFFSGVVIACGLTISLIPIVVLWAWVMGVGVQAWLVWGLFFVGLFLAMAMIFKRAALRLPKYYFQVNIWPNLALLSVAFLIVVTRLWPLRYVEIPLWGDSYQHTMIVQLMLENGGLFSSWQPYSFSSTFTYHFAFHAVCLFLGWLLGLSAPQAVLLGGQILNILAVFMLYPLAYYLSGKQIWAGIFAILAAGIVSEMPAFYINWGRYTQLTGHVVFPLALLMSMYLFQTRNWQSVILAVLTASALFLSHYRVVLLFAAVALVWFTIQHALKIKALKRWLANLALGASYAGLSIAIIWPWMLQVINGRIPTIGNSVSQRLTPFTYTLSAILLEIETSFDFLPDLLLFTFVGGAVVMGWRHFRTTLILFAWVVGWLIVGKPYLLLLPGTGLVSTFAVQIALYIPFAVGSGVFLAWFLAKFNPNWQNIGAILLVFVLIGIYGPPQFKLLQKQDHAMITHPDTRAAQWIEQNIDSNALIYVDGFKAFGDTAIVGSDGGWWLPLLAHRATTMPPLAYVFEQRSDITIFNRSYSLIDYGQNNNLALDSAVDYLKSQGVTHLYIGQRQGIVGNPGPAIFDPNVIQQNPRYNPIYHQDRVWVFELTD